ncbi:MAG: hypothetical protein PHG35_01900 [Dehalococcoidales bacterium]|nr:hypothetical protein [Dehalococcoidales bacterium]
MLTLREAKDKSDRKWTGIQRDYPDVKFGFTGQPGNHYYGRCGLCEYFKEEWELTPDCKKCPLFPKYCASDGFLYPRALYWRICKRLESDKKDAYTKRLIDQMVEVIRGIKV